MRTLAIAIVGLASVLLIAAQGQADSKDGPRRWTKTLKKSSEVVYKVVFVADNNPTKRSAEFAVIGDGSTDVDIIVLDAAGKVVAKDEFFSDLALVRWTPAATQQYTIKVRNLGTEDNVCTMGHN